MPEKIFVDILMEISEKINKNYTAYYEQIWEDIGLSPETVVDIPKSVVLGH